MFFCVCVLEQKNAKCKEVNTKNDCGRLNGEYTVDDWRIACSALQPNAATHTD